LLRLAYGKIRGGAKNIQSAAALVYDVDAGKQQINENQILTIIRHLVGDA